MHEWIAHLEEVYVVVKSGGDGDGDRRMEGCHFVHSAGV